MRISVYYADVPWIGEGILPALAGSYNRRWYIFHFNYYFLAFFTISLCFLLFSTFCIWKSAIFGEGDGFFFWGHFAQFVFCTLCNYKSAICREGDVVFGHICAVYILYVLYLQIRNIRGRRRGYSVQFVFTFASAICGKAGGF